MADTPKQGDPGKRELDERAAAPMTKARPEDTIFQAPFSAPPKPKADEKPSRKSRDEMTPAEKAADTRARNARREKREAKAADAVAEHDAVARADAGQSATDESAESAFQRTWSCPQCGRGTTLGPDQQPLTAMRCEGCGRDSMGGTWLSPGTGHGEPTLQVPPVG